VSLSPPVSVVMPLRNALPYLDESVGSILSQSFADFEFVILDDASDDGSTERLRHWADRDPRIRLVRSDSRLGPVGSSRAAVERSRAPLVARMDADDWSHPGRLARQVELFDTHRDAAMAGTLHSLVGPDGRLQRGLELSPLLRPSRLPPVHHGSIMFRREAFDRAGGYRDGSEYWEDLDLYARLAEVGRIFILPHALYRVRSSPAGTRINADPAVLDRAYARMSASLGSGRSGTSGRVPPGLFVLSGSPFLWAGQRPGAIGRLLRGADLRLDGESAYALLWSLWAEAHPRSLRAALAAAARLRERRVPAWLRRSRWVEWKPGRPIEAPSGNSARP
jgi:glycosyltransferase involved in cell wall biosynthesis